MVMGENTFGKLIRNTTFLFERGLRSLLNLPLYYNENFRLFVFSMKIKPRKSFEPTNILDSTRTREKFLTGVKRHQFYNDQLMGKERIPQGYCNHGNHLQGQSMASNSVTTIKDEGYSRDDLTKVFQSFAGSKKYITEDDLTELLRDQNQEQFKKCEMIRMLDENNKGYVTLDEFLSFYLENKVAKQKTDQIPQSFEQRRIWRECIEQNFELMQKLKDKQYCAYVASELRRLKDVNIEATLSK